MWLPSRPRHTAAEPGREATAYPSSTRVYSSSRSRRHGEEPGSWCLGSRIQWQRFRRHRNRVRPNWASPVGVAIECMPTGTEIRKRTPGASCSGAQHGYAAASGSAQADPPAGRRPPQDDRRTLPDGQHHSRAVARRTKGPARRALSCQICIPQRRTVRFSMVWKITCSTNRPNRITVSRPAKTSGISS